MIDGSHGEGGGQILRTSLTLSAILEQPIRIENIRAGRKNPGLQPQHLTAARAIAKITDGRLVGSDVGSMFLEFYPRAVKPGNYTFDVSDIKASAGSVNLIFQTILLPLAFAGKPSRVIIRGGTHVPWSPTSNFIDEVYLPMLAHMGVLTWYEMRKAGYYPVGGGEIEAEIRPVDKLRPITFCDRAAGNIICFSAVSGLPRSIAARQMTEAVGCLRVIHIESGQIIEEYDSVGKGTVVFIIYDGGSAKAGFSSLGERGKPAETVAREACKEFALWWESGAAIDKHLADQLIVPMALAGGESAFSTAEPPFI